jgi:FtsZ-interacting cell division protein ZipA
VSTALIVTIVVVIVVVILLLAIFFAARRSRARRQEQQRERSREEFGSEYERTAQEKGSEEEAERELRRRRGSVERNIEPLPDERRDHFEAQWGEVERVFVDNPEKSIEMADRTVSDILHERRFVTDSSQSDEETEKNLAVLHPDVADDYREARRMRADVVARSGGSSGGDVEEQSTEDLRQAIQRYRTVYGRLMER